MNDLNLPEFIEYHETKVEDLLEAMVLLEGNGKSELAGKLDGVRDYLNELRRYYLENKWMEL